MAESLSVKRREELGTARSRRLRRAGHVPAILYGHGEENVALTLPTDEVTTALRHGAKVVQLTGDVSDTALIREIQWDAMGIEILHLDLTRVSASEEVEVTLAVEVRGVAPGVSAGGQVQQQIHELTVRCPANAIPEKIEANINSLEIGDALTVADLELPEGIKVDVDSDQVVVQCVEVSEQPEVDEEGGVTSAEPEVIGRSAEEDEGGE